MKILITGAGGFVGKNLVATLENIRSGKAAHALGAEELTLFPYDLDTPPEALRTFCAEADFVVHLAGVNRPEKEEDFMRGNFGFSKTLLDTLSACGNHCPVLLPPVCMKEMEPIDAIEHYLEYIDELLLKADNS